MNQEQIPTEDTYYKKVLISSGEVPENEQQVTCGYTNGIETMEVSAEYFSETNNWCSFLTGKNLPNVYYWLKPVSLPSPKQEAIEFAEWLNENYTFWKIKKRYKVKHGHYTEKTTLYTLSELYDKFKEEKKLESKD